MTAEFRDAVEHAEGDPAVIGIVITGAGRAFCAGADFSLLEDTSSQVGDTSALERLRAIPGEAADTDFAGEYTWLLAIKKPVIAAINGPVAGMALSIALCCDLRFMAADATLFTSFSQWGLIGEWGIAWLLPRLVGTARSLDLLLSSRKVSGIEAEAMGVVNRALPTNEVLPHSIRYVRDLAENCSPTSMAIIKHQVYSGLNASLGPSERQAIRLMIESFAGPDFKEGIVARSERRPTQFGRLGDLRG
jgi:enoyl-CoA hydratase/carnithine racemase